MIDPSLEGCITAVTKRCFYTMIDCGYTTMHHSKGVIDPSYGGMHHGFAMIDWGYTLMHHSKGVIDPSYRGMHHLINQMINFSYGSRHVTYGESVNGDDT